MKYQIFLIDDEADNLLQPFIDDLESYNPTLDITIHHPDSFEAQIVEIEEAVKSRSLDAILLDLRLDGNRGDKTKFRGLALAQEIRTRATEMAYTSNKSFEFPIVLISTDERIEKSSGKDVTGNDLFDRRFVKSSLVGDEAECKSKELECLIKGYRTINGIRATSRGNFIKKILGVDQTKEDFLDLRILNHFGEKTTGFPTHQLARFIIDELIDVPGPLINEDILAARLGIDKTSPGWSVLLEQLPENSWYKGAFYEAYPRWWFHFIEKWWLGLKKNQPSLRILEAGQRTEAIIETTGIEELKPAAPLLQNYSTSYWTVCKCLNLPIDPVDSFRTAGKEPLSWQENNYISKVAALSKACNLELHALEKEKYIKLVERLNRQL